MVSHTPAFVRENFLHHPRVMESVDVCDSAMPCDRELFGHKGFLVVSKGFRRLRGVFGVLVLYLTAAP
jgi:hypothetical protein